MSSKRIKGPIEADGSYIKFKSGATEEVTVQAGSNVAAATFTLPAATDTLVGRASTDTLTNKTLNSPTLVTPALGTPTSGTLTNCTGLPLTSGVTGTLPAANGGTGVTSLGTGVATALGQNVTGSGGIVLATSPALTTPDLGTPSAATLTNATGLPLATGVTGTLPVANGGTGITLFGTGVATALGQNVTGSGGIALATSPTFVTPNLGTPSAATLTNATGLPLSTGVTGTLPIANGGTGQTSQTAAFDALAPSTTKGDLIAHDGTDNIRFAVGADGTVLTANSANPSGLGWTSPLTNPMTTQGDIITGGASGAAQRLALGTQNYVLISGATDPAWGLIANANIDASAAIARSKLAAGTASHVVVNDGSGNFSSEATLAITRGGTGAATATAAFDALSPMTTLGDVIYGGASGTRTRLAGNTNVEPAYLMQVGTGAASAAPSWRRSSQMGIYRLHTGNGHGSTNTCIRRFTTAVATSLTGITFADSATLGSTFTCTEAGIYSFSYTDAFSAASLFGLSLNSNQLSTSLASITAADRLIMTSTPTADGMGHVSFTIALAVGDIVRPHTNGTSESAAPSRVMIAVQRIL